MCEDLVAIRGLFVLYFEIKMFYNVEKCKKMQKNEKKLQKNLHISKKSCNFAPSFKNKGRHKPKK